ncbi:hypothetical protein [Georgenia yuyongxinii]
MASNRGHASRSDVAAEDSSDVPAVSDPSQEQVLPAEPTSRT